MRVEARMPIPMVIDLSHHNGATDFAKARAAGLVAVIHKATQGASYVDPQYATRRKAALQAGLVWGAYHFCTNASVDAQVSNFVNNAKPDGNILLAMDFEKNEPDPGNSVSLAQGRAFLAAVERKTGLRPIIYTGSYMYDLLGKTPEPTFGKYRVWWARYSDAPQLHPTWKNYWLWQYTDGHSGPQPRAVDGIGYCDCDHYDDSEASLRANWLT
jgi:lysozyme